MKIALKEKKLKNGMTSLYIESYKGSSSDENGKRVHLRDFKYLNLYQYPNPKTAIEKKNNKENLVQAENILAILKADFAQGKYGHIKAKNYSFSAGQYFEVRIDYVDITAQEFTFKMQGFEEQLNALFEEGNCLDIEIQKQLKTFTYNDK